MHQAAHDAIIIPPDRIKREYPPEAFEELKRSIASKGLMHPPAVRPKDGQIFLVAGEHRLKAMLALHKEGTPFRCEGEFVQSGMIPFVYLHEMDPITAKEAELEENTCRRDLTWQERAKLRDALFTLRKEAKLREGVLDYTPTKFAEELQKSGIPDSSVAQVFRDIQVAKHLETPEVAQAKTLNDGAKAVKKKTENFLLAALGEMVDASPIKTEHRLIEGDALTHLALLEPNQYDCVLTDPPYGIDIDDAGSMVANNHHYADSAATLEGILDVVPYHLWRITRDQAHVYWFCDLRWFSRIAAALEDAGFAVCKFPIIWWKRGKAMVPDSTRWPKREYECILFASKGDRPPLKVAGDVIATSYTADLQQAEKPKELYTELLSRSVMAGQKVIDPFCGSGVIFTAADALKCSATGIELDPERADFAKMRAYGL